MADRALSPFGINTHIGSPLRFTDAERTPALDCAAATGASWMREEIRWDVIQPQRDTWSWDAVDAMVAGARARGLEILALLDYNNLAFAAPPNHLRVCDPPDPDAWAAYVTAVVERYKDYIHAWEVWNEPDVTQPPDDPTHFWLGDVEDYVALLGATYATIKGIDPTATVLHGGCSDVNLGFVRAFLAAGGADHVDAFALHPYVPRACIDSGDYQSDILSRFRDTLAAYGKPVWFTEFGWSAADNDDGDPNRYTCVGSPRAQARYLVRQYVASLQCDAPRIERLFWYQLRDGGTDAANPEDNYGLVRHDFTPKDALAAYRQMATRLAGAAPLGPLALDAGTAYRFDRDGTIIDVVWGDGAVTLPTDAPSAAAFDLTGDNLTLTISDGQVSLDAGEDPIYVEYG